MCFTDSQSLTWGGPQVILLSLVIKYPEAEASSALLRLYLVHRSARKYQLIAIADREASSCAGLCYYLLGSVSVHYFGITNNLY